MIELCGLELQSAAGPKTVLSPTADVSLAITLYISYACRGSPVAPMAILPGPIALSAVMTDQVPS